MTATAELTVDLKRQAWRLGFDLAGAAPAVTPEGIAGFYRWLEAGYAGQMRYLADRAKAYEHPRGVLPGARSLLMLAMNYHAAPPEEAETLAPGRGRVARYAWGRDYHEVAHERLRELCEFVRQRAPGAAVRGVVDTAPLLEREFAQLAGLGWIGKNTLLLNRRLGSWFFLAALLTDLELEYDAPHETDHCGTCRACLDACPTDAFVEPYVLDSRRCISYMTIELREQVPEELRTGVDDWLFGCDICQEVCPWNHRAPLAEEPEFAAGADSAYVDLAGLFDLDEESFRRRFRHTPLWRAKRRGLLRNAALVLGNHPQSAALAALEKGLNDAEPLVRQSCAWALSRYPAASARQALAERLAIEEDADAHRELLAALDRVSLADARSADDDFAL